MWDTLSFALKIVGAAGAAVCLIFTGLRAIRKDNVIRPALFALIFAAVYAASVFVVPMIASRSPSVTESGTQTAVSVNTLATSADADTASAADEAAAQAMLEKAQTASAKDDYSTAIAVCKQLQTQYPGTSAAAGVNTFLSGVCASAVSVSAEDLCSAYSADAVGADGKYLDKTVLVTGTVVDVGTDVFKNLYLRLDSGSEYTVGSVQCYFGSDQADAVNALSPGDTVKVIGRCEGSNVNVLINDCDLIACAGK